MGWVHLFLGLPIFVVGIDFRFLFEYLRKIAWVIPQTITMSIVLFHGAIAVILFTLSRFNRNQSSNRILEKEFTSESRCENKSENKSLKNFNQELRNRRRGDDRPIHEQNIPVIESVYEGMQEKFLENLSKDHPPHSCQKGLSLLDPNVKDQSEICESINSIIEYIQSKERVGRGLRTKRIVLLRHGESQGNVHPTLFASKPDPSIPLTDQGLKQAFLAGRALSIPKNESVCFYVSPYLRSWQSCERVIAGWCGLPDEHSPVKGFHIEWTPEGVVWYFQPEVVKEEYGVQIRLKEDPRLRELEWSGTFQNLEEMPQQIEERRKFGAFYFRFKGGESGGDAYVRVSAFLETMQRDLGKDENFVLVSHGLTIRLLLMRYFHWSVALFHTIKNFRHCEMVDLLRCPDGRFRLAQNIRVGHGKSRFPVDNFVPTLNVIQPPDVEDLPNFLHLVNLSRSSSSNLFPDEATPETPDDSVKE